MLTADHGTEPTDSAPVPRWFDRAIALATIVTGAWFVVVLSLVHPDQRGFGTHEQLGMAACGWPMTSGVPCPTCGVTTAATWLVHLRPDKAIATHPFGALFAGFGLYLIGFALSSLLRRRPFIERLALLPYGTILVVGVALLLGSWWYKYLTMP